MCALPVSMNPDQRFWLTTCRASWHQLCRQNRVAVSIGGRHSVGTCHLPAFLAHYAVLLCSALARSQPRFQPLARLSGAVMKRSKPNIQRKIHAAIITLKIAVMKLMMEMPDGHARPVANNHFMKAGMAKNGR